MCARMSCLAKEKRRTDSRLYRKGDTCGFWWEDSEIFRRNFNGKHYHMAVKLERLRRWKLVKNYLKDKHGIVVHFSNTHDNYYSAWKYVTKNDKEVLESPDHPTLWNSKPPRTQKASEARASEGRLKCLQHTNEQCEHEGVSGHSHKKKKRMSAFELSQIIVENEITTRTELLAFADQQKEEGKTDIAEFVVN